MSDDDKALARNVGLMLVLLLIMILGRYLSMRG